MKATLHRYTDLARAIREWEELKGWAIVTIIAMPKLPEPMQMLHEIIVLWRKLPAEDEK